MSGSAWCLAVSLLALAACRSAPPAKGQIVLYIDTDAPLPAAAGMPPAAIPALFDRIRIDVYPPGATDPCDGCTQVVAVDADQIASGRLSLGIMPPEGGAGYAVRARMYRAISVQGGEPTPDATVDVTAALPVVTRGSVREISLLLHVDDLAAPVGSLDHPIPPTPGKVTRGHAGTWPGAQPTPCVGDPRPDEVCVPGGAYWMGNPLLVAGFGPDSAATLQRIVVVSPFFLSAHEITVGTFRDSGDKDVTAWSGSHAGQDDKDWCSFTPAPSSNDAMPVNCITWASARQFCQSSGADLPTEAQFEYVGGGMASLLYIWGAEDPKCGDAVYGRGGFGVLFGTDDECRSSTDFGGPETRVRDRSDRDQLQLAGGTLVDLAGNLAEWARDRWEGQDGPCWGTGVFTDPVCDPDVNSSTRPVRGGKWSAPAFPMRAAWRASADPTLASPDNGFRCARPATGP
jgi:formylglycine-generating enzyme required for sulfatase activity